MHLVSVSGVAKSYDGRRVLEGVTFGLTDADRVGVVGPNGSGKSTLLRIVAGLEEPDEGSVVPAAATRVAYLDQTPDLDPGATALDVVEGAAHDVLAHEAQAALDRFGVDPTALVGRLSGGQRRRVSVARALVAPSDLLILDEPTNHLDVDTIDLLEEELGRRRGGLLLVTHDRYLLERVTTRMLDVDPQRHLPGAPSRVWWHDGSYADLLEARAARLAARQQEDRRRRNLLRTEIAWLRRGPKARTSKPKFRLDQAAAMAAADDAQEAGQLQLGTGRRRLGRDVIAVEDVRVRYDATTVLDGVDLRLGRGDRVGIVGPNGSGKTTLLRVLVGDLTPDAGRVRVGSTVEVGFFRQETTVVGDDRSVLDTVLAVGTHLPLADGTRLPAARLAERFGFDTRLQQAAVERLSGGERRRLALLHLLIRAPNVLVFDEPTNDLDLDTLRALEDHLDGFDGTIVVASHDRYLLDRVTDQLWAVEDGRLRGHLDWERYRDAHRTAAATTTPPARSAAAASSNRARQDERRRVRSLETRMETLTGQRDALSAALAEAGADHHRAAELDHARRVIEAELAAVEDEWLELSTG